MGEGLVDARFRIAYGRIEQALRDLGFAQDPAASAPICRWHHGSGDDRILLDVMPTREEILGFSNRWYPLAIETATSVRLPSELEIRVITAPAFLRPLRLRGIEGDVLAQQHSGDSILRPLGLALEHKAVADQTADRFLLLRRHLDWREVGATEQLLQRDRINPVALTPVTGLAWAE